MRVRSRIAAVAAAVLTSTLTAAPAHAEVSRAQLAQRWAPIHYQDVDATGDHAVGGKADWITGYDYDGDLNGRNNWDNLGESGVDLSAKVYYSVLETSTTWYLTYLFFHPRDWIDHPFFENEHENDGEGLLLAVERDGSEYGTLRSMVTVAHSDFFSYTPAGSTWTGGREGVDGTLELKPSPHDGLPHPVSAQEVRGHALKAWPQFDISGDGIIYYPSTTGETPSGNDDRDVRYRLVDIFAPNGLWARRNTPSLMDSVTNFAGDTSGGCGSGTFGCGTNSASPPWGWDDGNDLPGRGELATDPAKLSVEYWNIPGGVSRTYDYNPYRSEVAEIARLARTTPLPQD